MKEEPRGDWHLVETPLSALVRSLHKRWGKQASRTPFKVLQAGLLGLFLREERHG